MLVLLLPCSDDTTTANLRGCRPSGAELPQTAQMNAWNGVNGRSECQKLRPQEKQRLVPFLVADQCGSRATDVEASRAPACVATGLGFPESGNIHPGAEVRVVELMVAPAPTFAILCFHTLRS
ncbi:hypothetical protein GP2_031_00140 [Gordonia paraffinivorans NBRC 108238]|uniref:Uncharacterized protein n=1 Tax=Gordonia paraffinivorans NBRC 108238 TaxID=1223543 RepID=A0ABQ0IP53_9ACTN|nr:hypothetical protein GP2_031_00140 [Gordonia paraffinivorans NBRC 108238]